MTTDYITMTEAAKCSPGRPHISTIWRWARKGVKARNGSRINLEHIRAGGRLFTTEASLERFFKAVAEADQGYFMREPVTVTYPKSRQRTARQREKDIAEAEKALDRAGIL
jgi:Protein of unknown function (DUF1580)